MKSEQISKKQISDALVSLSQAGPLKEAATKLLDKLGYKSRRTENIGGIEGFKDQCADFGRLTSKQMKLIDQWNDIEILFQFTNDEVVDNAAGQEHAGFNDGLKQSFLFVAIELADESYTRTFLANSTRIVNKIFRVPVILLFRYNDKLTISVIHSRLHKTISGREVLSEVTLIKDINLYCPHRAHLDILYELTFMKMVQWEVNSFDELHKKWEKVLDIEILNKRFYQKIFDWFERAKMECRFPDDGEGKGSSERHVIRLITRILFIWFLKEKKLVPNNLFDEQSVEPLLTKYDSDTTDYYRAILQNLFFATLNTEIDKRQFGRSEKMEFHEYRYRELIAEPDKFIHRLESVPFVNGGLFDCMDDVENDGRIVDAFTDDPNQIQDLSVPARLFFDNDGLFEILNSYKFTLEESTPLDREVALDPELLGRVFENLLAAYNPETHSTVRKQTGSFYTPRQVVDYMVRESLIEALTAKCSPTDGDIPFWRERLEYLFNYSAAMDDANELFEKADRKNIVSCIANLRTLDPAVGSGAFIIGILKTLTLALRRLDPDNKLWSDVQRERAKDKAAKAFDYHNQDSRNEALQQISQTFERYQQSDYGRKLFLIQNGIFGVDIQPIACQIAKLRFFISLIIEQEIDAHRDNLGISPLPNLETRILSADSLLSLDLHDENLFGPTEIQKKQLEIEAVREGYFLADSRQKKLKYTQREGELRRELRTILQGNYQDWTERRKSEIESDVSKLPNLIDQTKFRDEKLTEHEKEKRHYERGLKSAYRIANWDPYNHNQCADWFDPNYMFGVKNGFDVVIGNPPYIQLQSEDSRLSKLYKSAGFKTFEKKGDIYQLFYERGCGLLKSNLGILAYITSNSWLKTVYGGSLRQWLGRTFTPLKLIEMGEKVFENATVDSAILIVKHGKKHDTLCEAVDTENVSSDQFPPLKEDWGMLKNSGTAPWLILSSIEYSILKKIEKVGVPLRDWDISIYRGILTGYNNAFIISTEKRDMLVQEDPSSNEILHPILRGRDIARYQANWSDLWLIATFPSLGLDIESYPAIKRYLMSYGIERLAQEGQILPDGSRSRKKTRHSWYELQDSCAYHENFESDKIVWSELVDKGRFAYDTSGITIEASAFMIIGQHLEFLCSVLNSSVVSWFMSKQAPRTGTGTVQWKKYAVETIPVPEVSVVDMANCATALKTIVSHLRYGENAAAREIELSLDRMILQFYGLDSNEISFFTND